MQISLQGWMKCIHRSMIVYTDIHENINTKSLDMLFSRLGKSPQATLLKKKVVYYGIKRHDFHSFTMVAINSWLWDRQHYKLDPKQSLFMFLHVVVEKGQQILNRGSRRNVKQHIVGVVQPRDKTQKILTCSTFVEVSWDIQDATLLFFDHITQQDPFTVPDVHIRAQCWKFISHY